LKSEVRPWWAIAFKLPLEETIIKEDRHAGEKHFYVEAKAVYKSLHWVAYGPLFAITVIGFMGLIAFMTDVKNQPHSEKITFAVFFLVLPVIAWLIGGTVMGKLTQRRLARLVEATKENIDIVLNLNDQTLHVNQDIVIPFSDINDFKLISDSGLYFSPNEDIVSIYHLIMETEQGHITILPKSAGNIKQKLQLASQLEKAIRN